MRRLIYLPLEQYQERYTEWLSSPEGAIETDLKTLNIPYTVIRPHNHLSRITHGQVVDVQERMAWGFAQVQMLSSLILNGGVSSETVIFIEDFWLPGMEMIPYTLSTYFGTNKSNWPKMYAYCFAQSCDPNDFTAPWSWWIHDFECAWGSLLEGMFVSCPEHKWLAHEYAPGKTYVVGLPFSSEVVKRIPLQQQFPARRQKRVVWSSRWDTEKNPDFFMKLAELVLSERTDIKFVVCTGSEKLVSNDSNMLRMARSMQQRYSFNFQVYENLTKAEYYTILQHSRVQFNAASQDWVSNTLLEAATFGCKPLYPWYLSFPAALNYKQEHMYIPGDTQDAKRKLYSLIDSEAPTDLSFIYDKYDHTFRRMLSVMGFNVPPAVPIEFREG